MEALEAKAISGVVTAFTGHEYTPHEWRDVPEGCEAEARRNKTLDIRSKEPPGPEPDEQPAYEPADMTVLELSELTVLELRRIAKAQGVKGHGLKKAELITALGVHNE